SELAPSPHPLANAVAALASPAGGDATGVLEVLGFLSLGLVGWVAFRLGRELFSAAVGAVFAAVLLTAPPLVDATLQAGLDVPFLGLVLWAMALEAQERGRAGPLVVLAVAGLLRPEAWLLAAVLVAVRAPGLDRRRLAGSVALAAAAPVVWVVSDLIATGDPLHSLHATRTLGGLIGAPAGTGEAVGQAPRFLRFFLADPVVWAGLAGLPLALWLRYREALLPAAVLALGVGALAVLGVFGVPLSYRYGIVPAAMVALFAAVAVVGWTAMPRGAARSRWRAAGAAGVVAVLALSAPGVMDDLGLVTARAESERARQGRLREAVERPGAPRCVRVREFLRVPEVAFWGDVRPRCVTVGA
ncbi:MAG TPA: hypothetical protein VFY44_00455, partial [Thermoleophilaceae bacterium]|nr:hypothetical protein [Thermoleophilaceae bacterium]